MNAEWVIVGLLLVAGVGPLLLKSRHLGPRAWIVIVIVAAMTGVIAKTGIARTKQRVESESQMLAKTPREGRPGGYVTSDNCQACHPAQYESWHRSFHRTMTQHARPEAVKPDITQVSLELLGEEYHLERRGDEFWANLPDPYVDFVAGKTRPMIERRVCMLTGSHHMQVFWTPTPAGNLQVLFPFCYLLEDKRWVPFYATFLRDPAIPAYRQVWNSGCIGCHSTGGQPRPDPKTQVADTRAGELGIACEACHGPAEQHVAANQNPARRYQHRLGKSPDPTIVNPARLSAKASSQVCGQCHSIKWIPNKPDWLENGFRYRPGDDLTKLTPPIRPAHLDQQPWLREPLKQDTRYVPDRYWPDGVARVSGRDYSGMIESACHQKGDLSCLSCHSMHKSDPVNQVAARMETAEACFQCHKSLRDNVTTHTRHKSGSSGSDCYNCHMPHTTYGLLKAIRSHYIDAPKVKTTVETGRPNACNLCHLDKSLGWTAKQLTAWYGQPSVKLSDEEETVSAAVLMLLRGDAGQRALIAWAMGWEPALAASGSKWEAPFLGQLLADPYSANRYIAARSLRRLPGFAGMEYDFVGPEAGRTKARDQVLAKWQEDKPDRAGAEVLLSPAGRLQWEEFNRILLQRDDKSIDLQE
ncbi:MAG TPA: multiheme c-type cytochrome [Verrucomicrobiae bacterium]|nr:multiheme c-type cytochrome [Verrucomicrobiae bacterium]